MSHSLRFECPIDIEGRVAGGVGGEGGFVDDVWACLGDGGLDVGGFGVGGDLDSPLAHVGSDSDDHDFDRV